MTTSTSTTGATTSFKSGSINVQGLGNGTDFSSLIDGLVSIESNTKTKYESWKKTWQQKVQGFQYLNTKMLALKTSLASMDTVNEFMSKTVSVSDSSALSASASGDAIQAAHTVVVGQLAQNDILTTGTGVSSLSSTISTSNVSLTFSYAGSTFSLSNIGTGLTLSGLVNYINNNATCSSKIKATTIYDGSSYHLQIYGLDMGDTNQVSITSTTGLVFNPSDFQNTQQAQSSHIKVDGYPVGAASWISRDTNSVEDVIPGVTLTLKQANSNATLRLGVTTDTAAIKKNIETFVSNVNSIRTIIKYLTMVSDSSGTATGSLLTGNYGVQLIASQLKEVMTDLGLGFSLYNSSSGTGDYYSTLSQLGITTDADESSSTNGLLLIDDTTLDAALSKDPDGVAKLFAANYDGESESKNFSYVSRINGKTKAGSYNVQIVTSAAGISSATIDGKPAGIDGWKVTALSGDAAGLVVQLDTQTPNSTFNGVVDLKLGKTGELSEKLTTLTNSTDGPLAILEDNYGDIMTDIQDKIDRETQRIAAFKQRLTDQYARLDALLNTLTNTQTQLTSTISQLSSSSS